MSLWKRWAVRIRSRARSARPRARLLVALAAALVVVGAVWMALEVSDAPEPWTTVGDGVLSGADLSAAAEAAGAQGLAHRIEGGRLHVPASRAATVRELLTAEGFLDAPKLRGLDHLAAQGNLWETPAQRARRWQAGVMTTLAGAIGDLPGIRRATVLFDPGVQRTLGRAAVSPAAAIKVTMADGRQLGSKLALTIADFVSGSIAGMDRSAVKVVDNGGRSYHFDDEGVVGADDSVERLREAETYLREKILLALAYVQDAIVGVSITNDSAGRERRSVSVRLPRSYLAAVYGAAQARPGDPNDTELEAFAGGELAKVRQLVMGLAGTEDANAVTVDWYYDVPAATASRSEVASNGPPPGAGRIASSVSLGLLGLLAGWGAWRRRRRRAVAKICAPLGGSTETAEADTQPEQMSPDGAEVVLERLDAGELRTMLQGEHSQAIALVLSHVSSATAGKVLGTFEPARQVDISRRIAALAAVDADVLAEAVRGLLVRRDAVTRDGEASGNGAGRVAKILHHAGFTAEQTVLEGLGGSEPDLAESIRRRMFVFDDVAELPRDVLTAALESIGSSELAIALRAAGKRPKEKILASLSRDAANEVESQMEQIGPVRLSDVEAAQEAVVEAVRRQQPGRYIPDRRRARGILA